MTRRVTALLLMMALLLGQIGLLAHEYDFAAHKAGDTCITCLHASSLGHALAGATVLMLPHARGDADYIHINPPFSTVSHNAYRARAPPHPLSII